MVLEPSVATSLSMLLTNDGTSIYNQIDTVPALQASLSNLSWNSETAIYNYLCPTILAQQSVKKPLDTVGPFLLAIDQTLSVPVTWDTEAVFESRIEDNYDIVMGL